MKTPIHLEELALFLCSVQFFPTLSFPWWTLPLFFLVPDVSTIGHAGIPALGAAICNAIHHWGVALLLYAADIWLYLPAIQVAGAILSGPSSLGRVLGHGLRLPDSFTSTRLGKLGRQAN